MTTTYKTEQQRYLTMCMITQTLTIICSAALAIFLLRHNAANRTIELGDKVQAWGGSVSAIIATLIFNSFFSAYAKKGYSDILDYALSFLSGFGGWGTFFFGTKLAVFLIHIVGMITEFVIYIINYIVHIICLIIGGALALGATAIGVIIFFAIFSALFG